MAAIEMQGNNWVASVLITQNPEPSDIYHVVIKTLGESAKDAIDGTKFAMDVFAKGRTAFLRNQPEVNSETDFDTKRTKYQGFARFSFKFENGAWQVFPPPDHIPLGIGSAA